MKKAQEDLIKNIDQLFSCLKNNRDFKLLSDQRDKLNFLIRFINKDTITEDELSTIKPFWHKSISDPLNVSFYIDEIAFLLRDNYDKINLPTNEKERSKNLIKLINERVMTDEEDKKKSDELYKKKFDAINKQKKNKRSNMLSLEDRAFLEQYYRAIKNQVEAMDKLENSYKELESNLWLKRVTEMDAEIKKHKKDRLNLDATIKEFNNTAIKSGLKTFEEYMVSPDSILKNG